MLIEKIEVKNYRCLRDVAIDCSNLIALIGRNGAGKSAILHALDTFYKVSAPISIEDFYDKDPENDIEIRVTYRNLSDEEIDNFGSYVRDEKLMVKKRISIDENENIDQKYFGAAMQIPEFAEIRAISGKRNKRNKFNQFIDENRFPGLDRKARSADDALSMMAEYEEDNPELTQPIEKQKQFLGASSIGGGSLDNFTKFVLVPAVREATEEISTRRGSIYKLIDMIVATKVNARDDIKKFKEDYEERIQDLYCTENLTELPELGNDVSKLLERFAPGSKLNLYWDEVSLPDIKLPTPIATLIEDDYEGDISRKGHGLQRTLILTLLHYLATSSPEENDNPDQEIPSSVPSLIIAIEEPELYLHPSRSRYLSEIFLDLSREKINGTMNQIIYATHSPYFVDLDRFDQIRLVRKVECNEADIPESSVTQFSLEEAAIELSAITEKNPDEFTDISFMARSIPIMNIIANEGFFADKIVVVEGTSDAGILWQLSKEIGANWPELGVVVVPANGKNNIDRPVVIFRGLSIPTYFLFDGDIRHKNSDKEEQTIQKNHRYLKLAGVELEDFPETTIHDTWAVLKEDIETEIKTSIGEEVFYKIRDEVANQLGYERPSQLMKNMVGSSKVIREIYRRDLSIQSLEEIVFAINNMETNII
jgi:predicted ATP-dependent endonuclease of OLD family